MVSMNIAIKDEAYRFLKSQKSGNDSFSDVILRFKSKEKGIMRFFGKHNDSDWDKREKTMQSLRSSYDERL